MADIGFIARNFPPSVGGAQRLNASLYRELERLCDVYLIANTGRQRSLQFYLKASIELAQMAGRSPLSGWLLSDAALLPLTPLAKRSSARVALQVYGLDLVYPNPLYSFITSKSISTVAPIICISQFVRKKCLSLGIDEDKCVVIYPGLDDPLDGREIVAEDVTDARDFMFRTNDFDPENNLVLLSVGRLVPRKGFKWFASSVLPELSRRGCKVHYVVVGDGPDRGSLLQAVKRAGVSDMVTLTGSVPDAVLSEYYMASDLFVMPNVQSPTDVEGYGLVVPEAGCYGLPVIASAVDAIPETLGKEESRGLLLPQTDVEAFALAVEESGSKMPLSLQGRNLIRRMTLDAHRSWKEVAADYLDAIQG